MAVTPSCSVIVGVGVGVGPSPVASGAMSWRGVVLVVAAVAARSMAREGGRRRMQRTAVALGSLESRKGDSHAAWMGGGGRGGGLLECLSWGAIGVTVKVRGAYWTFGVGGV